MNRRAKDHAPHPGVRAEVACSPKGAVITAMSLASSPHESSGPPQDSPEPSVLTIEEAARSLRIGRNSAYEAARRGELPTIRIGRRLLVPRAALERMLEGAGVDGTGDGDERA